MIWPERRSERDNGESHHRVPRGPNSTLSRWGPLSWRVLAFLASLVVCLGALRLSWFFSAPAATSSLPTPFELALPHEDRGYVRANPTVPVSSSPFRFSEIATAAGIDFVHDSGGTDSKHFPTAYGSGVAIFDADNDGKLDIYFANGTFLPVGTVKTGPNRFFRNLGGNRFQDVTLKSGLGFTGFCHGIAVGDIDNDGDQDVFLCNNGGNVLFRNNGDGTFKNASEEAGLNATGWSTSAAFLDFDRDGDLDLYVANYGHWKLPDDDLACFGAPGPFAKDPPKVRIYCSPKSITPSQHYMYRNNGNGTFTDVAESAGLTRTDGRGLGVVALDLNNDNFIDIYVANDICPNFVFLNRGDGTFDDVTEVSGAGYDQDGHVRAGMGVDAEDVNGDGRPDVFVTNYWNEPNSLFINLGEGRFEERSRSSGMMHDSLPWVGWGCALADFDNDGWPDCFVANGQIDDNLELIGHTNPYEQPALLHQNLGGERFKLATRNAGPYFDSVHVGRGVASGDLDNDGDIDLVVNHMGGSAAFLRNDTMTTNHWIRLRLEGTRSNRDAVGARVEVEAGERTIVRQRKGGSSIGSAHDPRLLFGLGTAESARRVTVYWPSGRIDIHTDLASGVEYLLREGAEKPEPDRKTRTNDGTASVKPGR